MRLVDDAHGPRKLFKDLSISSHVFKAHQQDVKLHLARVSDVEFVLGAHFAIGGGPVEDDGVHGGPLFNLSLPVTERRERRDDAHRLTSTNEIFAHVLHDGDALRRLPESHLIAQNDVSISTIVGNHPLETRDLILAQRHVILKRRRYRFPSRRLGAFKRLGI